MHNGRHGQRQQICWYILPIIFDQIQREILKSLKKLCDWIQSAKSEIELSATDPGISGCKPESEIKDCNLPNTLHTMCFVFPCMQNLVSTPPRLSGRSQKPNFSSEKFFISFILHWLLLFEQAVQVLAVVMQTSGSCGTIPTEILCTPKKNVPTLSLMLAESTRNTQFNYVIFQQLDKVSG